MTTKEYKILESGTVKQLQSLVNEALTQENKVVTLLGGGFVEIYPNFHPTYYQAILIECDNSPKTLMEVFKFQETLEVPETPVVQVPTIIPTIWTEPIASTTVYALTGQNAYDAVTVDNNLKVGKKYKKKDKN